MSGPSLLLLFRGQRAAVALEPCPVITTYPVEPVMVTARAITCEIVTRPVANLLIETTPVPALEIRTTPSCCER